MAWDVYFQYRKVLSETWLDTSSQSASNGGFFISVDQLDHNTEYEFRAVVEEGATTLYGETLNFTTADAVIIEVPLATADAAALVPASVVAQVFVTLSPPVSTSQAEGFNPALFVGSTITGIPPPDAAAGALASTVSTTKNVLVSIPVASSETQALVPTVTGGATIQVPVARVEGEASTPVVTAIFTYIYGQFYSKEVKEEFEMKDVDQEFFFREVDK